ncbi:MAG TPA: hypothetical protein VJ110_01260 [Candidatus Nanoarchaeia archaeon]|nr:hypothetical protein [Candidatus Nanoarchaeia archaeon]
MAKKKTALKEQSQATVQPVAQASRDAFSGAKKAAKVLFGLIVTLAGLFLVMTFFPEFVLIIKGIIGVVVALIGILIIAIGLLD